MASNLAALGFAATEIDDLKSRTTEATRCTTPIALTVETLGDARTLSLSARPVRSRSPASSAKGVSFGGATGD